MCTKIRQVVCSFINSVPFIGKHAAVTREHPAPESTERQSTTPPAPCLQGKPPSHPHPVATEREYPGSHPEQGGTSQYGADTEGELATDAAAGE